MTSPIRFQVNSVRSLGTQSSRRESIAGIPPNLGIIGRVVPVEATLGVKSAWASTQRDVGQGVDEFKRATRPPDPREPTREDEAGTVRRSSVPIAIPFVALQRAVAAFDETRPRIAEPDFQHAEAPEAQAGDVQDAPVFEDPFQQVREHLKEQADGHTGKEAEQEPTVFVLPKEPAKPFGRAVPFESASSASAAGEFGSHLGGDPGQGVTNADVDAQPFSGQISSSRRSREVSVAEAALRGAITQGLAGVDLPRRVTKKAADVTGPTATTVTRALESSGVELPLISAPTASTATTSGLRSSDANTSPTRWSVAPADGGIRIPRGTPRAEIASSQYRAVEDNDYAKLLAVPGESTTSGRWSRIGATLPTFAFSVTS